MSDSSPNSRSIQVLHVDDEPSFSELVSTFLERTDDRLDVTTADDASEALTILDSSPVDCIVSDHDMPGMNGLEFLAEVRERDPNLPFILFTGKGSEEIASDAISAGVTDYFEKKPGAEQYELLANRIRNAVEQYRANRAVSETETRFQELTDNANDVLWMFTADWEELLFVNDQYEAIYGPTTASLESAPGTFLEAIHPEDRDSVRAAMKRLSDGESVDIEYRVNEAEDFSRWVWVQGEPIFEDGEVVRVAGFTRDITDRKERERQLEEERSFAESLFESIPDVFYTLDENGELQRWNDRFTDVTGYDDEEVEAMHASDIFPDDQHEAVGTAILEVLETGHSILEADVLTKDGDRVPYELTGARLTGPDGERRGIVGIGRDITRRKEREHQLEEFAGVVSHDLRNPLMSARGFLELAESEGEPEHFDRVENSLDRMDRIISDVLWLARQGESIGETEPVELETAVEDAWQIVAETDTDASIEISDDLGTITADPDRLAQLLENVLGNAIDHTGDGVTIRVEPTDGGFLIEDDGPGIPTEDREQVFDHGYSTRPEGTGFGLSIVSTIADAHGWSVALEEGSTGGVRLVVTTD